MNELISIIIPAYNAGKYIRETMKSILSQTYKNIEIICVDDGSADSTYQTLRFLAASDERIRLFKKKNEGVTLARRFGFEQAKGAYIGFVDADDIIEPTMFERLYHNIKKYDADISHCAHDITWLDGRIEHFYGTGRLAVQGKISGIRSLISGSFEPGLCNKLYKYTLLHSLFHDNEMDFSIKINEDLLMNYYLFKQAETTVLEDICLYHYMKRAESASTSNYNQNHIWDPIKVKQIIAADAHGTEYEDEANKMCLHTCVNQYNNLLKRKNHTFDDDKRLIRDLIIANKKYARLLSSKQALGTKLIILLPEAYAFLYQLIA